ncbi:homoserine dehydrogenase [Colwellia chukchiensis]|uniref:Bifunctional aspartokinase/homoserine dehydrogenase n=1 Tax=Colwellia chukchiensis TaxID=641665 RepID=A0A1H7SXH2_9GAMM|nr:bifunctional aspartate kinase/homoserine dehydrogenase II [Colwellia chukchiensis]SEL77158.1 homoserine dehydrogenase [Colwellia chukchiensis]
MNDENSAVLRHAAKNHLAKLAGNIHKFGGSSLATATCIERVMNIIREHCQLNDIIVVSANGTTTNALFHLHQLSLSYAVQQSESLVTGVESEPSKTLREQFNQALRALAGEQKSLIEALLNASTAARLSEQLASDVQVISQQLLANPDRFKNDLLAYGEVWSARLLSALLNESVCPSYMLDAREFLLLADEKASVIDYAESGRAFAALQKRNSLLIVTGYIARNKDNQSCTLGRNGSDYSATIMAALSKARHVTLWTDVDGIYSADPRKVPQARKLHRLPNAVARELGRLGNPVLHAKTLQPLTQHNSHLHVASSFAADISGSEIGHFGHIAKQELAVTELNDLILACSNSFYGDSGQRAVQEFAPICYNLEQGYLLIPQRQQKALSQWLASYGNQVSFQPVAMIAVVGHSVATQGDMRARFKKALRQQKVLHFQPASNKHSYIAILAEPCTTELLNTVHTRMTKDAKNIALVVAGVGNIGQRFLTMLPKQLARVTGLDNVHLVALAGRTKALINTDGIDLSNAYQDYQQQAQVCDSTHLLRWLSKHPYDELIVVDITASEAFSNLYHDFFAHGIHVISANKWAASSSTDNYQQLLATAEKNTSLWLGNATVGAGLPINRTIKELLDSGDEITEISGIFSGTLSWLFQYYDGESPFSQLLAQALAEGITEPDPREDLSGRDVQRKLLILARAAGVSLSLQDIECQNLVPESLCDIPLAEFLQRSTELDELFLQHLQRAKAKGCAIRYVARFINKNDKIVAKVSLEQLSEQHAFTQLTPCDNVFQINSQWYQDNALIIRGPGAGRDVTAGGIHADLVAMCQQLNHRQPQVKLPA